MATDKIWCVACERNTKNENEQMNALSRYEAGTYICSDCGTREAFEGPFWLPQAEHQNA
jgi:ribosomal protein L37AE/L43A